MRHDVIAIVYLSTVFGKTEKKKGKKKKKEKEKGKKKRRRTAKERKKKHLICLSLVTHTVKLSISVRPV